MPKIVITRGGGWTDRLRSYAVWIDDVERGAIKAKATVAFEAAPGPHEVQLRIGALYRSQTLRVDIDGGDVLLSCGSNTIPGLAFLSLARPDRWIRLERQGAS